MYLSPSSFGLSSSSEGSSDPEEKPYSDSRGEPLGEPRGDPKNTELRSTHNLPSFRAAGGAFRVPCDEPGKSGTGGDRVPEEKAIDRFDFRAEKTCFWSPNCKAAENSFPLVVGRAGISTTICAGASTMIGAGAST
ncbi:hypothetical protein F2Q69_00027648 [Brassica cretica]|uniref:Uncharacterized protein n=1 Tax=Brassica cretica TaxID=69181 RepID=A0A8S9RWR7_BRACR|nr:hypothetical protein F2Q69_00027648 [Brassica cretica]